MNAFTLLPLLYLVDAHSSTCPKGFKGAFLWPLKKDDEKRPYFTALNIVLFCKRPAAALRQDYCIQTRQH